MGRITSAANRPTVCSGCGAIPDYLQVDTLHEPDAFPTALVAGLAVVSGDAWDGQRRRCVVCGAHFEYTYDHDSQSGVGYGYTDETNERLFAFETRADGTLTLRSVSMRVTGAMLRDQIRDRRAMHVETIDRITALEIDAWSFGDAPPEIGDLPALDLIWFKPCGLTSLPPSVSSLSRLARLWIHGNPLTDLPTGLASLPVLEPVSLANTAITRLPDTLTTGRVSFTSFEANVVPPAWRASFVADYSEILVWLSAHGAAISQWDSGAWSHEDRYHLEVTLPGTEANALRRQVPQPFAMASDTDGVIELHAAGRAGADVIVVRVRD
jgi:hypothetical protein